MVKFTITRGFDAEISSHQSFVGSKRSGANHSPDASHWHPHPDGAKSRKQKGPTLHKLSIYCEASETPKMKITDVPKSQRKQDEYIQRPYSEFRSNHRTMTISRIRLFGLANHLCVRLTEMAQNGYLLRNTRAINVIFIVTVAAAKPRLGSGHKMNKPLETVW